MDAFLIAKIVLTLFILVILCVFVYLIFAIMKQGTSERNSKNYIELCKKAFANGSYNPEIQLCTGEGFRLKDHWDFMLCYKQNFFEKLMEENGDAVIPKDFYFGIIFLIAEKFDFWKKQLSEQDFNEKIAVFLSQIPESKPKLEILEIIISMQEKFKQYSKFSEIESEEDVFQMCKLLKYHLTYCVYLENEQEGLSISYNKILY